MKVSYDEDLVRIFHEEPKIDKSFLKIFKESPIRQFDGQIWDQKQVAVAKKPPSDGKPTDFDTLLPAVLRLSSIYVP